MAVLTWTPPTLNTNYNINYFIEYDDSSYTTLNTTFEIDLDVDSLFLNFYVSVINDRSAKSKNGTRGFCHIGDTYERRTCKFKDFSYQFIKQFTMFVFALIK